MRYAIKGVLNMAKAMDYSKFEAYCRRPDGSIAAKTVSLQ
jgi:hypothetical protein